MGDFFVVTVMSGGQSGSATSGIFNDLQFLNYPRGRGKCGDPADRRAPDRRLDLPASTCARTGEIGMAASSPHTDRVPGRSTCWPRCSRCSSSSSMGR